jgi:TolA-binding protein
MRGLLFTTVFLSVLNSSEISIFDAGNLDSKNPYGLTKSEKSILKNRDAVNELGNKAFSLEQKFLLIDEKIDGFHTVINGNTEQLRDFDLKMIDIDNRLTQTNAISSFNQGEIQTLSKDVSDLKIAFSTFQEQYNSDIANFKKAVNELTVFIKEINSSYVSKKEIDSAIKDFITFKEFKEFTQSINKSILDIQGGVFTTDKSNYELMNYAKKLFDEKSYGDAVVRFEYLIRNNYKPATSNFYLGEIYFLTKDYEAAVHHYKISVGLYDKASYIPTLLLHSAISFDKLKDRENAKLFYTTLIDSFPDSKEAKEAQNSLEGY